MAPYDEVRHVLAAADRDFRALVGMTDPDVFADEVFGFHAQQAVEKSLKAWLSLIDVEYPRTHDISLLLNVLAEHGEVAEPYEGLIEFNSYAVQYRYGAYAELGDPLDRLSVVDRVGKLLRMVRSKVDALTI